MSPTKEQEMKAGKMQHKKTRQGTTTTYGTNEAQTQDTNESTRERIGGKIVLCMCIYVSVCMYRAPHEWKNVELLLRLASARCRITVLFYEFAPPNVMMTISAN